MLQAELQTFCLGNHYAACCNVQVRCGWVVASYLLATGYLISSCPGFKLIRLSPVPGRCKYPKYELSQFETDENFMEAADDGELVELDVFLKENDAPDNLKKLEDKVQYVKKAPRDNGLMIFLVAFG